MGGGCRQIRGKRARDGLDRPFKQAAGELFDMMAEDGSTLPEVHPGFVQWLSQGLAW